MYLTNNYCIINVILTVDVLTLALLIIMSTNLKINICNNTASYNSRDYLLSR